MNLRIVTIGSVFFLALAGQRWISAADQHGITSNPLRGSGRDAMSENGLHPFAASQENTSPPRSPPEFWRNPGSLRTDLFRSDRPLNGASMSADPAVHDTQPRSDAQPPRTLIQRIRDRRLMQLEKQAERLRELSERDAQRPDGARHSADPNGPENVDLQIDLGIPADACLPLIGPFAAPSETQPE